MLRGMQLSAVFFDLDVVLIDGSAASRALTNAVVEGLGRSTAGPEVQGSGIGRSGEDDVGRVRPSVTDEEIRAFLAAHGADRLAAIALDTGATAAVDALDARGVVSAVITNARSVVARSILEAGGCIPHALVGVDDVARPMPAPDVVFRACEVVGVPPWEALVVGDSGCDRRMAEGAGCLFAGMGTSGQFTIGALAEVVAIVDGAGPSR